jgi:hypothetical protein
MFVRKKVVKGGTYYYLVQSGRAGGKVRQKVVAYLGTYATVQEALEKIPAEVERLRQRAADYRARAEDARRQVSPSAIKANGGEVPRRHRPGLPLRRNPAGWYWIWRDGAESYERRAAGLQHRLHALQALARDRGAQDCLSEQKCLGTTTP